MSLSTVAVLFARADSTYKSLPGCDVWDAARDARCWNGGAPVVAHPPCRAWGRLRQFAKPRDDERDLAPYAIERVRAEGGVLEHPAHSSLWDVLSLPKPGQGRDEFGGWTLPVMQHWWGHRAEKATWLYIVGINAAELPEIPMVLGSSTHVIAQSKTRTNGLRRRKGQAGWRPEVSKAEREATPPPVRAVVMRGGAPLPSWAAVRAGR
ncbi:hypothetical protein SAMN02745857_01805 [Andreprevotia lacus DSM 23236]|jgi:hypothetical protein|uniref:Uncharacterized protein n=1 Tax=Andreprevotia lacus DSM 23236 TaxID=1121001 RepID=A0A1W1XK15_9NEIS|nr:hypothetical protein [Andreprevotia lacus]SMC24275.1 hypothetical protein SAMN02745857_01805 [Andreprevotia lacus DSM 23236]